MRVILLRAAVLVVVLITELPTGTSGQPLRGELDSLWDDLGTDDPVKAHQAITALVARAKEVVPFFQQRLGPVPQPSLGCLARLLIDLDSDSFQIREDATRELQRLGEAVEPQLRKALSERPSPEMRLRIKQLLESYKADRQHPSPERLRQLRAVEVLEQIADSTARQLLAVWAQGAPAAPLTRHAKGALERLGALSSPPE
jgi:hypothetical protein